MISHRQSPPEIIQLRKSCRNQFCQGLPQIWARSGQAPYTFASSLTSLSQPRSFSEVFRRSGRVASSRMSRALAKP